MNHQTNYRQGHNPHTAHKGGLMENRGKFFRSTSHEQRMPGHWKQKREYASSRFQAPPPQESRQTLIKRLQEKRESESRSFENAGHSHDFAYRKNQLQKLADYLVSDEFFGPFIEAYVNDTAFVRKDVIKREVLTPAALLRLSREEEPLLKERLPLGQVGILVPKNSLGLTLAKAISSSYLMGNRTIIHFPSQLKNAGPIYRAALLKFLDNVEIADAGQSSSLFMRSCLSNPDIKALVIYGDDSWINAYKEQAKQTQTKMVFEGPGNDPLVVMENADLEAAAVGAIEGGLNNGGQSCSALERFFVHEKVVEEFHELLCEKLKGLKCGSPYDEDTDIGPIASKVVFNRIIKQIEESVQMGARLTFGGQILKDDQSDLPILVPAVLENCTAEMPVVAHETFGPVFPLIPFHSVEDLIPALDATKYGLNASLYGSASSELIDYLSSSHRNFYINSTSASAINLPTRLMDGGFRNSGIIWDFSMEDAESTGRRALTIELSKLF